MRSELAHSAPSRLSAGSGGSGSGSRLSAGSGGSGLSINSPVKRRPQVLTDFGVPGQKGGCSL